MSGEHAVVTGSTAGIGRAIAVAFAREGANVVVTGRNEARGAGVAAEIADGGGHAWFLPADLNNENECEALIASAAERMGALTVLVNNAAGDTSPDAAVA